MLAKVLGIIWSLLGLIWLIKPESLRNRIKRKMNRTLRRVILGFIIVFVFAMMASVLRTPGVLSRVIAVAAIILIVKGMMLITTRSSDKFFEWLAGKPVFFFRIWALLILLMGLGAFYAGF